MPFFFPLEPRICETGPGSLSGATPENPRERRRGAGEDSAGGLFGVPPQSQPRPHLRGGGTLRRWTNQHLPALTWPPPPGSREPRFSKGRAELSGALTRSRGSFSPNSLQPWGSLVGLSRPSSSASSSYSRYTPLPCLTPAGTFLRGQAGSARGGGVGERAGLGCLGPRLSGKACEDSPGWVCRAGHACDPASLFSPLPLGAGLLAAARGLRAVPGRLRGS